MLWCNPAPSVHIEYYSNLVKAIGFSNSLYFMALQTFLLCGAYFLLRVPHG